MKKMILLLPVVLLFSRLYAQPTQAEIEAMKKRIQKQTDSILNDPGIKKMLDDAKMMNKDSMMHAAQNTTQGDKRLRQPDTTTYTLPKKNIKALAALPKKTLSTAELKTFLIAIDKKLTQAFRSAYGTPVTNTDKYDATTISNSSLLATELGLLDQAVLLSLKAAEQSPDNPVILNNTGAILKKGGLEIAAIPVLESALEKDPGNSTIQNNLGQSFLSLGDKEKAAQYLQLCVHKTTYHPLANSSLALIYLDKGDKQSALQYIENSLKGAFTDKAYHLLFKLKKDASLLDYMRHRYKQPEYFNEDKYPLLRQCENVSDIPVLKAEYDAYQKMLETVMKKFDAISAEETEKGVQEVMQKVNNYKQNPIFWAPFWELAGAMMLDLKLEMDKSGADELAKSYERYHDQINVLQNEYKKKNEKLRDIDCGEQIALANTYMQKMSVVTHEYQKTQLRINKDFYHDCAFWSNFTSLNEHSRRGVFCGQTSSFLGTLKQLSETHFLEVTGNCASNPELKKEKEEIDVKEECPIGQDGLEIPFGIGKFNISCEKSEFQIGELLVLNISHKFNTGETIWAIGPGVALSLLGPGHESLQSVPQLQIGPVKGGLEAGAKGQLFFNFKNGALVDWGLVFAAEIDVLGMAKELKTGFSIGASSGLEMEEGAFKKFIDENLGPKEDPQINKNVKKYKADK